jgi:tRNA threonylcarbamoyladenosine biosynthesis protein TsaE
LTIIAETLHHLPGEIHLPDAEATRAAGLALGRAMEDCGGALVVLAGPMGAGKTTLCQGVASALGVPENEAVSPTFALANVYRGRREIAHLDLYRLGDDPVGEFHRAGLEEHLDGLCLVEWPDRMPDGFWPPERLELELDHNEVGRWLRARGSTERAWELWRAVLDALADGR